MITVQNLRWRYKSFQLQIEELELRKGITLLVGNNGAGKTTFLHLLATAKRPLAGQIYYDKKTIEKDLPTIRGKIGFVPTGLELYQDYTVKKLLLYLAQLKGLSKPFAEKQISNLLKTFHLFDVADSKIKKLSQGMQQRIALIQAFLGRPKYIILDEPLNFLDIHERKTLIQYLHSISQSTAIIVATHELNEWEHVCEAVLWIYNGGVAFYGSAIQWKYTNSSLLWIGTVPEEDMEKYFSSFHTLSAKRIGRDKMELKCLSDHCPSPLFQQAYPTMEDALFVRKANIEG